MSVRRVGRVSVDEQGRAVSSRNLNSSQFRDVPLFDPGPEEDPDTYWHLSHEGGDWNPQPSAMHFGTPQAAMERGQSVRRHARGGDPMEGTAHAVKLRAPMMNPKSTPMSDNMANVLTDTHAEYDYWVSAGQELMDIGEAPDHASAEDMIFEEAERFRTEEAGAYYRNEHEDKGSISAVVNDPTIHVQHLGTVGYEPEWMSEEEVEAPNPITGQPTKARKITASRGMLNDPHKTSVLGTQFDWEQPTL